MRAHVSLSHDTRGIPAARTRCGGLDRRLLWTHRVVSRALSGRTRTIRASLPARPPAQGEPFPAILADIESSILPGITHWQSPNFYAYFPSNASGPAILGDLLSSGLGVQGMLVGHQSGLHRTGDPRARLAVPMLGLPEKFLSTSSGGGVIQDTASSASLCALLAARERATNFASNQHGCDGKLVAYTSSQTHSSLEKGAQIAGTRTGQPSPDRGRRKFRHAPRGPGAADRAGPPRGPGPFLRMRHRGHDLIECDRPRS